MSTQSGDAMRLDDDPPPETTAGSLARSGVVLAFFLLVAGVVMVGALIRRGLAHPLLDVLALLLLFGAGSAVAPAWRHWIGEAMVGCAAVEVVLPVGFDLSLTATLELVLGALLLGGVGVLQLERCPLEQHGADDDTDAYWRTSSLTRLLLDLLIRRRS